MASAAALLSVSVCLTSLEGSIDLSTAKRVTARLYDAPNPVVVRQCRIVDAVNGYVEFGLQISKAVEYDMEIEVRWPRNMVEVFPNDCPAMLRVWPGEGEEIPDVDSWYRWWEGL